MRERGRKIHPIMKNITYKNQLSHAGGAATKHIEDQNITHPNLALIKDLETGK